VVFDDGAGAMGLQFFQKPEQQEQTSYNPDFVQLVKTGRIISCEIVRDSAGTDYINRRADGGGWQDGTPKKFRVDVVVTEDLLKMLQENKVTFKVRPHSPFWQAFWNVAPFIIALSLSISFSSGR